MKLEKKISFYNELAHDRDMPKLYHVSDVIGNTDYSVAQLWYTLQETQCNFECHQWFFCSKNYFIPFSTTGLIPKLNEILNEIADEPDFIDYLYYTNKYKYFSVAIQEEFERIEKSFAKELIE